MFSIHGRKRPHHPFPAPENEENKNKWLFCSRLAFSLGLTNA